MSIGIGEIIDGKVVLPEGSEPLPEGAKVVVYLKGEPFDLTEEQEADIQEALDEIERGEVVDGDVVMAKVRQHLKK